MTAAFLEEMMEESYLGLLGVMASRTRSRAGPEAEAVIQSIKRTLHNGED